MDSQGEAEWQNLRHQLEWSEGFWLAFLFTSSPAVAGVLRQRTEGFLRAHAKKVHVVRPDTPEELSSTLSVLFTEPSTTAGCVWLEALRVDSLFYGDGTYGGAPYGAVAYGGGPSKEEARPWTKAWEAFLLRLNERRERLRRHLQGGLLLAAPKSLKPRVRVAAPDLWSIRALVMELPSDLGEVQRPSRGLFSAEEGLRSSGGPLVGELSRRRRISPSILTGDPSTHAAVLQKLREAEALLSQDDARRAMVLASEAVEELEGEVSNEAERDLLSRSLATLSLAEEKNGDDVAATEHVRRAIELRSGRPHRSTFRWFERWIDLTQNTVGDQRQAEDAARGALKLARELLASQGENPETLRDLSVALIRAGKVLEGSGDLSGARDSYEESLSVNRRRRALYGETAANLRDLWVSLIFNGRVLEKSGNVLEALKTYQESLEPTRRLLERYGEGPDTLRDLSIILERLGKVLERSGDVAGAREALEESVSVRRHRLTTYGKSAETLRDLSVSLCDLGQVLEKAGEPDEADTAFSESLGLVREILESYGERRPVLHDLSHVLERIANFKAEHGYLVDADELLDERSRIQRRLA